MTARASIRGHLLSSVHAHRYGYLIPVVSYLKQNTTEFKSVTEVTYTALPFIDYLLGVSWAL